MSGTVDHIGMAVKDIEKSISFFKEVFGAELLRKNVVGEQNLISGVISLGSINVELMQSTKDNSVIDKFIKKKGGRSSPHIYSGRRLRSIFGKVGFKEHQNFE